MHSISIQSVWRSSKANLPLEGRLIFIFLFKFYDKDIAVLYDSEREMKEACLQPCHQNLSLSAARAHRAHEGALHFILAAQSTHHPLINYYASNYIKLIMTCPSARSSRTACRGRSSAHPPGACSPSARLSAPLRILSGPPTRSTPPLG